MILATWLLVAAANAPGAAPPEVDAYVRAQMERQRIPGLALAVVRDGQITIAAGFGLANVEHQVAVKPETVFQSGSTGKQFTAAAALLLADEGRLGLEDPVGKYVPAPAHWRRITVRHLLTHTSGIAEYTDSIDLRRDYTEEQLVRMAGRRPLDFPPGTRWSYSNTAYAVLGAVIRKASGKFYGDVLEQRIFQPLGMETARVISEADIVPDRAAGYRLEKDVLKNQEWVSPTLNTTADGALYLSVLDLAKWARALDTEVPLRASLREQMWTPARLSSGAVADARGSGYALGWFIGVHNGQPLVEHGGSWQGFKAWIGRFPGQRMSVIALSNLAESDPGVVGRGVAEILVPGLAAR